MISEHRRLFAVNQIGLEKIPAILKEYSDDEAFLAMVDSNLQREEILPSEKALAAEVGESRNQIHRYLRLTEVIPEIYC